MQESAATCEAHAGIETEGEAASEVESAEWVSVEAETLERVAPVEGSPLRALFVRVSALEEEALAASQACTHSRRRLIGSDCDVQVMPMTLMAYK